MGWQSPRPGRRGGMSGGRRLRAENAEGPGPLHPLGNGGADPRTSPHTKDRSSYGGCSVCLAEDIFQKLSPSFLSCTPGRCLLAARDNLPPLPHPAWLSASCLPLLAKPSLSGRAPVPCPLAMSRAMQALGRALVTGRSGQRGGSSGRPGPGSAAVPAPLPGPASAPRGCSRPPAARQGGSSQCQACVFVV